MDLLIAFLIFGSVMMLCVMQGTQNAMLVALSVGLVAFYTVARRRGFTKEELLPMMKAGAKRGLIVVKIFILIGLLTALWRSGGTITFFVYHGIRLIPSGWFILAGFGLTCLLGYALGTSFGITGTVGVILMTIARSGGVPPALMAGVVLSGAYFGDRTSPASSCANLVATITGTDIFHNVRGMLKSALVPMIATTAFYAFLSPRHPLTAGDGSLLERIADNFDLSLWCALPAVIMLVLPLCKVKVRTAMGLSAAAGFVLTVTSQGQSLPAALKASILGYVPSDPVLVDILSGGGVMSMFTVSCIIVLSSAYSGIFEGTRMLDGLQERLAVYCQKITCCGVMTALSGVIMAVFCNQTIGIMMIHQLLGPVYEKDGKTVDEMVQDIANTIVVMVALCPWCIACAVPLEMLGVGAEAILWSALVYLIPLWWLGVRVFQDKVKKRAKA